MYMATHPHIYPSHIYIYIDFYLPNYCLSMYLCIYLCIYLSSIIVIYICLPILKTMSSLQHLHFPIQCHRVHFSFLHFYTFFGQGGNCLSLIYLFVTNLPLPLLPLPHMDAPSSHSVSVSSCWTIPFHECLSDWATSPHPSRPDPSCPAASGSFLPGMNSCVR